MAADTDTVTRVRWSGSDFNTISDELLTRLQVKFASNYNDFAISSLGIMLIDLISYGLDTLSFYIDRRATDGFMATARTTASATKLSRQLAYKPGTATAASVDVQLSLGQGYPFPITVPVGYQLLGPNGLVFEVQQATTFSVGDTTTHTVTCAQGKTLTANFFSDATPNQVFQIATVPSGSFIAGRGTNGQSQTSVLINGAEWTEQDFLVFGVTEQYEVGYGDAPPTLRFGDGIAGKIPDNGTQIQFTFFATAGVNGSATAGTITRAVSPLVVNTQQIQLVINNQLGTQAGSPPESLSSIKANAPAIFKTRDVNVTQEDYQSRAKAFSDPVYGRIAVADAINAKSSSDDAYLTSLLNDIEAYGAQYVPLVSTAAAAATAANSAIATAVADATSALTAISTDVTSINSDIATAKTSNESSRSAAGVAQSNTASVTTDLTSLTTAINGFTVAGATTITTADKSTLINLINSITAKNTEVGTQSATIVSNVTSVASALDEVAASTADVTSQASEISTDLTTVTSQSATIGTTLTTLSTATLAVDNETMATTTAISDHVSSFLANDCKANLIQVPILTYDSDGFYVLPTLGLVGALQTYLDNGKDISQVVQVVAVPEQLVAANISVVVGILTGYNESTVKSQVQAAILAVLKGRPFGLSLRLSELYAPTAPQVGKIPIAGVEWIDIAITGPADHLDVNGNLTASKYETITRGTITVTSEIVSKSTLGQ